MLEPMRDERSAPPECPLLPGVDRNAVRNQIHQIVGDLDLVDDIEQDVSVLWHRNRWRWGLLRNRTTFVCQIARNQASKRLRREKPERQRRLRLLLMSVPLIQTRLDPLNSSSLPEDVERLLSGLRPHYRHAWLRQRLGWSIHDIAEEMGGKVHTVKHYLSQAADFFHELVKGPKGGDSL